jgi:ribosomal protein S18 acetylase RimI-like enzyme
VKLRKAEAPDLAVVTGLTRRAYEHYVHLLGAEPWPMMVDYAPRIAAGEVWLLEESTEEPVALIALEDHGDHLHIFSVAVLPEHQSQGIGRRLLGFAEEQAREMQRPALTLCTGEKMTRNIGIYRRYGFIETRRRPNPNRPGWVLVDMEKTLGQAEDRRSA